MKIYRLIVLLLFISFSQFLAAQKATIRGIILNENNTAVENVNIVSGIFTTQSNKNGFYKLTIPSNQKVNISFTHISNKKIEITIQLEDGEDYEFNPKMNTNIEQIGEVVVNAGKRKEVEGIQSISPKEVRLIPGANAGVENILKSLPGVNSNNELSTQYAVRGGNYDENLVYVDEIEVYRPFLIRSGQQEGLSFINSNLIQNVDFSAGGFQAKYGDKLSSVLDITYKKPITFGVGIDLSLLGGSATVETVSKNSKFSSITGLRYRDNSLLVNSRQTETNFNPIFADIQTYLTYKSSSKLHFNFLGNISLNDYNYQPHTRQTNFGTLTDPIALVVFYEGQEKDTYTTTFGALKVNYFLNNHTTLKLISSAYHTTEEEHFDILAQYGLGDVNSNIGDENLGEVEFVQGIGSQLTHARNDLDALIFNLEHKGVFDKNNHVIEWGLKFTHEDIRDRLREYEVIDSAGFSIRPPLPEFQNNQPYAPFEGDLEAFNSTNALNFVNINRFSGYAQWSWKTLLNDNEIWVNAGIRAHQWNISGDQIESKSHVVFSPRAQLAIKPNWKKDVLFRLAGGVYQQPPFYRELRDSNGFVQPEVKAQKSYHLVAGNDFSFKLWNRPFKLVTEAYYKHLSYVNPYTLENVRIRYRAKNNAEAYAYGLDLRLNGEFVPGTESWVSFGYLKTEENIENMGYISRPTDQRLKFAILFQDYVPKIPSIKLQLNLVYNTGLPGGSPNYADPYQFQTRLRDYKRADVGIIYVLKDQNNQSFKGKWLNKFEELNIGFEIFNLFDVKNSITNTWVRDTYTKRQYGVPNFMTGRVLNIKLGMKF